MDYQSFNGVRPSIRIRILVVDDDYLSLNMAATTLRSLKYEVLTAKHPFEALSTLHLMKGGIDLVVSDYHMPDMNGVQLQKRILEEFKIPVIMMSVDSRKYIMVESLRGGSKVFVVKPVQVEKLENAWQYVVANNKGKSPWTAFEGGVDRPVGSYLGFQDRTPVSFSISCNNKHSDQDGKDKNHKVIWTNALHTLFLQAINQIGLEKAVPKKILDIMKVPGLTRQHVASHLQKYRIFLKKVADRGLVKWNDPQKALNDAFELSMASNAQYHDMVLSLPPSQFARSQDSQPKFGSSSSVISFGNDSQYGATNGESSSSSHHYPNHGRNAPNSSAIQNSNNMGGGFEFQGFGSDSRSMFQSQQFGRGTEIGFGSSSAKNLNSASWNGNPNTSCNIQNGLRIHGKENQFPTHLGLNSMVPNPNNRSFDNQIGHGMPAKENDFPTAPGLRSMMSTNPNPNNMSFRVLENEPARLGLNSMSSNPNNWCFNNQIGHGMPAKENVFLTALGSTNPNNMSFRVLENEPTRLLGLNSMSPNPNNRCFNNQIGHGMPAKENVFPTAPGLKPMMSTNPNNTSFGVLENEQTRLGVNSMSPNPNHTGITMGGNEHLIPSRTGLSGSYNPDNGFDIRVDSTKGALVFENNYKWTNPMESNTSGHGYGEPPSFNINVLNSTPTVTNNLQENCASNDIEVSPYVLDELDTTVLPPPPADMSQKPTLGDDGFDCLYDLDLSELLLPQGDGDFDMAIEYTAPPLDENPTTNESEDQNWDDDFIGSLLVDDGPYMEANERSCCLQ